MRKNDDREPFDLHKVVDTNPIVKIFWWFQVIRTVGAVIIGLGLLIYFAYIILSGPISIFDILRRAFD